jgi:hypothetical protein
VEHHLRYRFQRMHRQFLLLATAQALFQTVSILVVTIGAIVGRQTR